MTQPFSQSGYLGGKLLIASPIIDDPRFERAVVFMCSHDEDQAMGLIVNRPLGDLRLPELLDQLDVPGAGGAADELVLDGGPMDRDRGFVLHTTDAGCGPGSLIIADNTALTATREILDCLASETPPRRALMALGYSGWDAGQLEDEIAANAWLVADADEDLLYSGAYDTKWARALGLLGVTPEFLTAASGHA